MKFFKNFSGYRKKLFANLILKFGTGTAGYLKRRGLSVGISAATFSYIGWNGRRATHLYGETKQFLGKYFVIL